MSSYCDNSLLQNKPIVAIQITNLMTVTRVHAWLAMNVCRKYPKTEQYQSMWRTTTNWNNKITLLTQNKKLIKGSPKWPNLKCMC